MRLPRLLAAGACAALGLVLLTAPQAVAAQVTVQPSSLAAGQPWGVSPNNTGTVGIAPLGDPIHADGSAHLEIAGGQRAQLRHPLSTSLKSLAEQPLSYQVYIDPAGSTPAAIESGVNLQLEISGPTFTTLSFQPQLSGGSVAGEWQTFTNTSSSLWRTSRAVGALEAGTDHTLADYIAAQGGNPQVANAYLNIGVLGDPAATLNAYADNVSIGGNTYNFATAMPAEAAVEAPGTVAPGQPAHMSFAFSSPADGPIITNASAVLTIAGPKSLKAAAITVVADGKTITLTRISRGVYSAPLAVPGGIVHPGSSISVPFTLKLSDAAPCGSYSLTGQLLSNDNATGVESEETTALPCPVSPPTTPAEPVLPQTGTGNVAWLFAAGAAALAAGAFLMLVTRRRRVARQSH